MEKETFVTLETYNTALEAEMVVQLLRNAGFPAFLEDSEGVLRNLYGPGLAQTFSCCAARVKVPADQAEGARSFLDEVEAGDDTIHLIYEDAEDLPENGTLLDEESPESVAPAEAAEAIRCPKCQSDRVARGLSGGMQTAFLLVGIAAFGAFIMWPLAGVAVYFVLAVLYFLLGNRLVCQRCGMHWRD